MFWKIIVRLLRCRNRNYKKVIPMKEGIYIVDIYRFIPIDEELRKWQSALEDERAHS